MAFVATGGLILACIVLNCVALKTQGSRRKDVYGNTWVVFVEREKRFVDDLAKRNGFINRGEIEGFSGHYLLEHKILPKRRLRRDATDHTNKLLREPHVKFALQQKILRRTKRGYFVDPYYKDQWYLNNSGKYTSRRNHPIQIEECTSLRMLAVFLVCISLRSSWLVNYIGIDLQFLALNERQASLFRSSGIKFSNFYLAYVQISCFVDLTLLLVSFLILHTRIFVLTTHSFICYKVVS